MQSMIHDAAAKGFQNATEAYDRGRPDYPDEAVAKLVQELRIQPEKAVLDLGAGTGKFTRLLLPTQAKLMAVEPVEGMRRKFSTLLPSIHVLEGTAETVPLPSGSVDAIVSAQAFHWFNGRESLREIHRVLTPEGRLGLIWNVRDESTDWVAQLTEMIDRHCEGVPRYVTGNWKQAFNETELFTRLELAQFRHFHSGPPEMVVDRVVSISGIAALPESERLAVANQVRELIATHPLTRGKSVIQFPYRTDVYWCSKI